MANQQIEAVNIELHPQAETLAQAHIRDFATSLLLQAKILAFRRKADIVLSTHIEEAKVIIESEKRQSWTRELIIILGGAFFGAFLQGFITELSSGRMGLVAIYTAIGFIGILMVFWSLRR